jgi:Ner family transcriptional regulator
MGRQTPQGWYREMIKAALRTRFGSLEHLSRTWGYHPSAISAALCPGTRLRAVERRIADALEVTPHTLWPDRWSPEGERLPSAERKSSADVLTAHRPKAKAA